MYDDDASSQTCKLTNPFEEADQNLHKKQIGIKRGRGSLLFLFRSTFITDAASFHLGNFKQKSRPQLSRLNLLLLFVYCLCETYSSKPSPVPSTFSILFVDRKRSKRVDTSRLYDRFIPLITGARNTIYEPVIILMLLLCIMTYFYKIFK